MNDALDASFAAFRRELTKLPQVLARGRLNVETEGFTASLHPESYLLLIVIQLAASLLIVGAPRSMRLLRVKPASRPANGSCSPQPPQRNPMQRP